VCATDWVEKMPRRKQKNTKRNATSVDVLLGKKIRARRMEMGVTQSDLAGALGVSSKYKSTSEGLIGLALAACIRSPKNLRRTWPIS
jgi:DNA-binding XRE family transcriptional regulator